MSGLIGLAAREMAAVMAARVTATACFVFIAVLDGMKWVTNMRRWAGVSHVLPEITWVSIPAPEDVEQGVSTLRVISRLTVSAVVA
jgi:hypothetical protein